MLDYGWGNPSSIMLPVDETGEQPEPNRPVFDPYNTHTFSEATAGFITSENHFAAGHPHHLPFFHPNPNPSSNFPAMYDSRASYLASGSSYHPPAFMAVPKSEPTAEFNSRIGLNLGGRTYFASSEDDFVNRLYRRSRMLEPGSANSPRCQVEGCNADLSYAKHYHRRHKVCEFHSKSATVVAAGLTQRFCQQCSRFHLLSEFDNGKRSCRKRLADHNRRRRKSQQTNNQESSSSAAGPTSSSQNLPRPPRDSSSVTVAISPPRISLDCFGSTASTNSLFYSSGD